jgi:hypothetical protein
MRRLILGVIVVAALAGAAVVVPSIVTPSKAPQAEAHGNGTNGCSVPGPQGWADRGFGYDFHNACDRHDICYINRPHGVNEWGRSVCDLIFRLDMTEECRRRSGREATNCYAIRDQFYNSVRVFGLPFFYHWASWVRANVRLFIV